MRTRAFFRRTLVAAGLSVAVFGLTAGVAEAKPRDCTRLEIVMDSILASAEANGHLWSAQEWQANRTILHNASDRMDALGC